MSRLDQINPLWLNVIGGLICAVIGAMFTSARGWWRGRRIVPQVDITVRRIVDPELDAVVKPRVLIIIFSGINTPRNPRLSREEAELEEEIFTQRVATCDYEALGLSTDTPSIGPALRAIEKYSRTLERVVLITTRKSLLSAPLLRAYVEAKLEFPGKIDAREEYSLNPEDDVQLTLTAYEKTKLIFSDLRKDGLYDPSDSRTLVDITGGPRALQVGVLLACLGRDQNIHLIGSPYGADGRPITKESFPMIVHFVPHLRTDRDS